MAAPKSEVAIDLFSIGTTQYLVLVDRTTGYLLAYTLSRINTRTITDTLSHWFDTMKTGLAVCSGNG